MDDLMDNSPRRRKSSTKSVVNGDSDRMANITAEEEKKLLENDDGLRERFHTKSVDDDDDDIDVDSNYDDGLSLSAQDKDTFFKEMKQDCKEALHAGREFIVESKDRAEEAIKLVCKAAWNRTPFKSLPDWLQDNDFLCEGHRPQIESFSECFKSIFRIHTETGNIWTHLLGCVSFMGIAAYVLSSDQLSTADKWAFASFFAGAIICMGLSFVFHTVYCHSPYVGKLFGKLDYCGIAFLIFGSLIAWLHFGFYCRATTKIIYGTIMGSLSLVTIIVALWDKFGEPSFRAIRAGVFIALGLSGAIPAMHYLIADGWTRSIEEASLQWLLVMAFCYLFGAGLYACRVPERWFPGKCDIWFQSHQIFHVLVILACFTHYHGISLMATHRFNLGQCPQLPSPLQSAASQYLERPPTITMM